MPFARLAGLALVLMILSVCVLSGWVRAQDPKATDVALQVVSQLDTTYKDLVKRQLLSNREATAPLVQLEAMAWELRVVSNQYVEMRQQTDMLQRRLAIAQKETQDQVLLVGDLQAKVKTLEAQLQSAGKVSQNPPDGKK